MANEEHLAILKRGVEEWNLWRNQHPNIRVDLTGADLSEARLSQADLTEANLEKAKFAGASLVGAKLGKANLRCADLTRADMGGAELAEASLFGASLRNVNLRGVELGGSDLCEAHLSQADLAEANLAYSRMAYTVFSDLDLSVAKGLERVRHSGPSTVGIDTIYRSGGNIPKIFLTRAGVPEEFITYMNSLVANPIEFYSCFISYSTKDQEFADRLYADLQNKNVRCWFAPHDVQGGKKLHEQIDEAIRVHEKVLLILSESSMSSEWVKTEIAKARKREVREKKQVLFPVRLVPFEAIRDWECFDADAGKDSAREVREYFILDFSEWKDHDKYKKAFERLLGDLKAGKRVES